MLAMTEQKFKAEGCSFWLLKSFFSKVNPGAIQKGSLPWFCRTVGVTANPALPNERRHQAILPSSLISSHARGWMLLLLFDIDCARTNVGKIGWSITLRPRELSELLAQL